MPNLPRGLTVRIAAKLKHVKRIVYTPHAYAFLSPEFSSRKRAIYTLAERILCRHFTDMTINCSHSEYNHAIEKRIDCKSKSIVIPNAVSPTTGINRNKERTRLGFEDKDIIVGTIVRVSTQNNPHLFDKIANAVNQIDHSIKFVWVGSNQNEHRASNVVYLGEMSNAQALIGEMILYLSTALFEGLSYSLLEAASVGVPVLASNVPGNDEFIDGYDCAFGFELTDTPEGIAGHVVALVHDKRLQRLMPQCGDFEAMIHDTVSVYNY